MFFVNGVGLLELWYTLRMDLLKRFEGKILLVVLAIVTLTIVSAPLQPSDVTHEIQAVGTRWVYEKEILYVQAWSRFSPQTLFVGALYDRYVSGNRLFVYGFEVFCIASVAFCIFWVIRSSKTIKKHKNTIPVVVGLLATIVIAPHVWSRGITPEKMAIIGVSGAIASYAAWRSSGPSRWLLGTSQRNFRYLVLAGVGLSFCIFSQPWLGLVAVPFFYDLWFTVNKKWAEWFTGASLLLAPIMLEMWLVYSALAPRQLFLPSVRSLIFDRLYGMRIVSLVPWQYLVIVASLTIILLLIAMPFASGKHVQKSPLLWSLMIVCVLSILILGTGAVTYVGFFAVCLGYAALHAPLDTLYSKRILLCCLVVLLPLVVQRFELGATARLESLRLELARGYVEQRTGENNNVIYFGKALNFYSDSALKNPTPFYDAGVFIFDDTDSTLELEAQFRGSSEAESPLFVVIANASDNSVPLPERLRQYFDKHYMYATNTDGYTILKRIGSTTQR